MNQQSYDPRHGAILVTGASSGIGAAIVRLLAENNHDVVAIARRTDRLAELAAETGCRTAGIDVRESDRVDELVRDVKPSVIINNAGIAHGMAGLAASAD